MTKTYRFRLKPTSIQETMLTSQSGAARFIYNWALEQRIEMYRQSGKSASRADLSKELTQLKRQSDLSWLRGADAQSLQQALRDLDRSFDNFFSKRAGFPKFKSRHTCMPSFRIPQRVRIQDGKVYCPKIGWIRLRQSHDVVDRSKSATFKQDALGHWYVTLITEFYGPESVTPATAAVGIDLGLKDFIVTSTGERTGAPQIYRNTQRKLRKAQKALARSKKASSNRKKDKLSVARVHAKIRNQRHDFLHKLSTRIVREHPAVAVENLNIKGLARTKLAKSVTDAGWGEFVRQLEYKCLWAGKPFVKIDRWYPSSKTCHRCGSVNKDLHLKDRVWHCECGNRVDRDLNAALNIRQQGWQMMVAAGHADTQNACGDDVRLSGMGAIVREAGISSL